MKPESRENILQEIAEAKQQIAHLRKKQEDAEITLQLLNERLFQYDKAITYQTTDLSADYWNSGGHRSASFLIGIQNLLVILAGVSAN